MAAFFQDAGLTSNQAAAAVSLNAIFTGLGGLGWGWTIEKIKARYCYAMVAAVMSICAILFSTVDSLIEAWIYASLFGTALGGMLVVPSVAMADYFGRSSLGAIRGFTEPFVSFSQAVGALFSGLIFDITGSYNYAFYTLSIVALMAILLTITATVPIHKDNKKG
jgi:MFS family permease